jgi:hypothetical protein
MCASVALPGARQQARTEGGEPRHASPGGCGNRGGGKPQVWLHWARAEPRPPSGLESQSPRMWGFRLLALRCLKAWQLHACLIPCMQPLDPLIGRPIRPLALRPVHAGMRRPTTRGQQLLTCRHPAAAWQRRYEWSTSAAAPACAPSKLFAAVRCSGACGCPGAMECQMSVATFSVQ